MKRNYKIMVNYNEPKCVTSLSYLFTYPITRSKVWNDNLTDSIIEGYFEDDVSLFGFNNRLMVAVDREGWAYIERDGVYLCEVHGIYDEDANIEDLMFVW